MRGLAPPVKLWGCNDAAWPNCLIRPRHFDVVVCQETLEHLPNPVPVATELMRRVKRGGVLIWDFVADHDGGANCATPEARQMVLTLLEAQHEGQHETWRRPTLDMIRERVLELERAGMV